MYTIATGWVSISPTLVSHSEEQIRGRAGDMKTVSTIAAEIPRSGDSVSLRNLTPSGISGVYGSSAVTTHTWLVTRGWQGEEGWQEASQTLIYTRSFVPSRLTDWEKTGNCFTRWSGKCIQVRGRGQYWWGSECGKHGHCCEVITVKQAVYIGCTHGRGQGRTP